jgi:hypothetical protein
MQSYPSAGDNPLDRIHQHQPLQHEPQEQQRKVGQTNLLGQSAEQCRCVQIASDQGVARLAVCFDQHYPEVTLAFCGNREGQWLRLPRLY